MKLQKLNVVYRVEDPERIQQLKAEGFKEVKAKAKADLNAKDTNPDKDGKDK